MSTREEMIAHGRTEAEVAAELGADSLAYLSLAGVYEAISGTRATHCDACFSGDYPLANTGESQAKDRSSSRSSAPRRRPPPPGTRRARPGRRRRPSAACANDTAGPALAIASQTPRLAMIQPARVDQLRVERARGVVGVARQLGLEADSPSARRAGVRATAARARAAVASIPSASRAPSARGALEGLRRLDRA